MITSYDTLPLGKYARILELSDEQEDQTLDIIAILADTTTDALLNMQLTDYRELRDGASFLFMQPEPAKLRSSYKVGPWSLRPSDLRKLTTAQYIDFKEFAKQDGEHTADMLAVLLVPDGRIYSEGYDVMDVRDAIAEGLMLPDALALRDFFSDRLRRSMRASLTSLRRTAQMISPRDPRKERIQEQIKALLSLTAGDGCGWWIPSANLHAVLGPTYID